MLLRLQLQQIRRLPLLLLLNLPQLPKTRHLLLLQLLIRNIHLMMLQLLLLPVRPPLTLMLLKMNHRLPKMLRLRQQPQHR